MGTYVNWSLKLDGVGRARRTHTDGAPTSLANFQIIIIAHCFFFFQVVTNMNLILVIAVMMILAWMQICYMSNLSLFELEILCFVKSLPRHLVMKPAFQVSVIIIQTKCSSLGRESNPGFQWPPTNLTYRVCNLWNHPFQSLNTDQKFCLGQFHSLGDFTIQ